MSASFAICAVSRRPDLEPVCGNALQVRLCAAENRLGTQQLRVRVIGSPDPQKQMPYRGLRIGKIWTHELLAALENIKVCDRDSQTSLDLTCSRTERYLEYPR